MLIEEFTWIPKADQLNQIRPISKKKPSFQLKMLISTYDRDLDLIGLGLPPQPQSLFFNPIDTLTNKR